MTAIVPRPSVLSPAQKKKVGVIIEKKEAHGTLIKDITIEE